MSNIAIKVENVSKQYRIGLKKERYLTLRDSMVNALKAPWRRFQRLSGQGGAEDEMIWALKDVSFEVKHGEVLGIIGPNGSGKSTLLKILCRVTRPTRGQTTAYGRVGSLLEVGTGFHPELTGRENIFLNGAIMGMTRAEIRSKFDEIVDFSGVEKFLDTPVKRYSSGMQVRLAFSVAAHLEPEILLVDEVLAVGDAEFQKKCMGKMDEVAKGGRTVLFVSHNMNAVERTCKLVTILRGGKCIKPTKELRSVIQNYLTGDTDKLGASEWLNKNDSFKDPCFEPIKLSLKNSNQETIAGHVSNDMDILVEIEGYVGKINSSMNVGYALYSADGILLYWSFTTDTEENQWPTRHKGHCTFRSFIPRRFLNEGNYRIELLASLHCIRWICAPGEAPSIWFTIKGGLSDSPLWISKRPGHLAPVFEWSLITSKSSRKHLIGV